MGRREAEWKADEDSVDGLTNNAAHKSYTQMVL